MGTKIKDAQLLESVTGAERIPVSDGSGNPKAVTTEALKNFVGAGSSGGGGIPIVDSEKKLETLNLPQGSLASVASDYKLSLCRELYQPSQDILDNAFSGLKDAELLSSVSGIEFTFPTGLQEGVESSLMFVPRNFSYNYMKMIGIIINVSEGHVTTMEVMAMVDSTYQLGLCSYDSNGVPTVNQEAVNFINDVLKTDDWCYVGDTQAVVVTEEQNNTLDIFFKVFAGIRRTDLFVKEPDAWHQFAKRQELDKLKEQTGYPVEELSSTTTRYELLPNTYYRITMSNKSLTVLLAEPTIPKMVNEYVIEIACSGQSVTFPDGIQWANGNAPVFDSGTTIVVSIVNNLAIFSQF